MAGSERELEPEVRRIVSRTGGSSRHKLLSGNPGLPGCPLVYGWVLSGMATSSEDRAVLRDLGFSSRGGKWIRPDLTKDLSGISLSEEQGRQALSHVMRLVEGEGCSFSGSRRFQGGTCAQENGRGWDCFLCAARAFLRSVGVDPEERRG